jgi:ferredoxin
LAFSASVRTLPALALSMLLAIGVGLGRLVCGFLCPFGWFQDLLHRIPSARYRLPRWTRWGKYLALLLLVFLFPFLLGIEHSGYLKLSKPQLDKLDNGQLRVTVSVENLGMEPVKGVSLEARYLPLSGEKGGEAAVPPAPTAQIHLADIDVPPGAKVMLPAFQLPNQLATANLQVTSPQSVPNLRTPYDLYYCRICPKGTLTVHLPRFFQSARTFTGIYAAVGLRGLRVVILLFFLVLMVFVSRPFCQTFCPLGAIYGLLNRFSLLHFRLVEGACVQCGKCDRVCPVDLDVRREVGGAECIACGDCARACHVRAIERRIGL